MKIVEYHLMLLGVVFFVFLFDPTIFDDFLKVDAEEERNESMHALAYVDVLRADHGLKPMMWSDELYELAMFKAEDMYNRSYFEHMDPDGKCASDYAKDYGIHTSDADNIGEGYFTEIGALKGWMDSRGHRYNLLYSEHTLGAIAVYKDKYVFLGTGPTESMEYGWECLPGDEGSEYWKTAPKQEGEI